MGEDEALHHSPINQAPHSCHGVEELASGHNLRVGPLHRKILRIAGHQVVGACGLGALQENVVVRIGTGMHLLGRLDPKSILPDSMQRVVDDHLAAVKLGTPDHFFIFGIDIAADAKLGCGPGKRHEKGPGGQTLGLQQCGNQNIRVEDDPALARSSKTPGATQGRKARSLRG